MLTLSSPWWAESMFHLNITISSQMMKISIRKVSEDRVLSTPYPGGKRLGLVLHL